MLNLNAVVLHETLQQLADLAQKDRDTLLRQLNSYSQPKEEGIA